MPKRTSKQEEPDENELAASIVGQATSETIRPEKDPAAVAMGRKGGLKGGPARAASLTPEEKKRIASEAARKRWSPGLPQATHEGPLKIGAFTLSAAVLPGGKRILGQADFLRVIGRSRSPKAGTGVLSTVDKLPFFLQANALQPFISQELRESTTPVFFFNGDGKKMVGYDAELLPQVADTYLKFRDAYIAAGKSIPPQVSHIIEACDVVVRGLARLGIVALVDEATGYQYDRARNALAQILERYIAKELARWVKTFPDEFYGELFRLREWPVLDITKRPVIVGKLTNDLVYRRMPVGVLEELERKNAVNPETGRRPSKHHMWLTRDLGHPALREHLAKTVAFMQVSKRWDEFMYHMDKFLPLQNEARDVFFALESGELGNGSG